MNSIEFYNKLTQLFPREKLSLGAFVNPLFNHSDFDDFQFIFPNGALCPPMNSEAEYVSFAGPLDGPFYLFPIDGCIISKSENREWYWLQVVVKLPDNKLGVSSAIGIKMPKKMIRKEIGALFGNRWYKIEHLKNCWSLYFNGQLVQKTSLQLCGGSP